MLGNDWDLVLKDELEKEYFKDLMVTVKDLYNKKTIYPKQTDLFKAFRNTFKL